MLRTITPAVRFLTSRLLILVAALFGLATVALCPAHAADTFPSHTIRILVPYAAGGPSDTAARLVADPLGKQLGTTVYVDNRGGAGGLIGTEQFLKDEPDGYTILLGAIGPFAVIPAGKQVSYDVGRDFIPLGCIWFAGQAIVASPKMPAKTIGEFIAYAKANPGKVTIGSAGIGSMSHLTIELFKREAGIDIIHVPFRSTGASLPNVLGGQVDAIVGDASVLASQVSAGKLRALAVASSERTLALPDVPTLRESGLPKAVADSWFGLVVSSKTPAPVVKKLQDALAKAQRDPAYVQALAKQKASAGALGPEAFAKLIHDDAQKWRPVIQNAGLKF
ncbi:MAG TPA: tripartite tricarboxylate transporter substrate binding protein [Xanthobacteraceae bacterium]|jgi:tripartite-type tricarboxylate transporter receptor subunit TctC|nr:tripartite tricarboxylate transporter substrate binding protein [Xanthobacteraceae bacterium]